MSWIRRHLTYANVISTLCLFLVLGGGAYAAFQLPKNSVRSKNIVDGAVKGKDVGKAAITGKAIKNKSVKDSDVQGLANSDGLIRLEPGDSQTILTNGPFTLTASCKIDSTSGQTLSQIVADSSVPDSQWTAGNGGSGPIPPQRGIVGADGLADEQEMSSATFVLAAPDGTTVTGFAAAGIHGLGSTCYALATGLGSAG
jgi:hypothetical protein